MRRLLLFYLLFVAVQSIPLSQRDSSDKLAFRLAQQEENAPVTGKKGLLGILRDISENSYVRDFMSLMKIVAESQTEATPTQKDNKPILREKARAAPSVQRSAPLPLPSQANRAFQASLSMDDAIQTAPSASAVPKKSISNEEWASTLFGERGVLTGIFQVMDQQRKAKNTQSDATIPTVTAGGKPFGSDFKAIFDSLLMGQPKGEFGDPGPELPEFLGICNRLSCGDIYKAIDKFRKSEFFSNFLTALTLVQDPNGWETIGKLLSNPELIAQFTAGSGMEEVFGSALGQAKKESTKNKDKNSKLMPEDGDFGTDFTDLEEGGEKGAGSAGHAGKGAGQKGAKEEKLPEIDFSIDGKPTGGDYYEEVVKHTDEEEPENYEVETVEKEEVAEKQTTAGTTVSQKAVTRIAPPTRVAPPTTEETPIPKSTAIGTEKPEPSLPELSFSIDGLPEEFNEGEVVSTVDLAPPKNVNNRPLVHSGMVARPTEITGRKAAGLAFVRVEKHTTTTSTTTTTQRPTTTTERTTPSTTTHRPLTTRRRPSTTSHPTTTTKNYRKDSDYYAMYYDEQPK